MLAVLLPLAVAATISNWYSIQLSERQNYELLETAIAQNANQLASDINSIRTTQGMTANVLTSDSDPGNICERVQRLFATIGGKDGISFGIFSPMGDPRCVSPGGERLQAFLANGALREKGAILAPQQNGVLITSESRDGALVAIALYRLSGLKRLTNANSHDPGQQVALEMGDQRLTVVGHPPEAEERSPYLHVSAPVGTTGMNIVATVHDDASPFSRVLSLVMPIVLLFSAALMGWLVVRWVLIKPLIRLQREVAAYEPGKVIHPPTATPFASDEITALGLAFHEMSEDVAEHEEEMRDALERQTRLTREVHHRVKNNLQIISSLISLHWRAAKEPQTSAAYLSIQRRVDALAVVQRHHYAELDEQRGVQARPMMNEIASGLKTSAQVQSNRNLEVSVDCDDVCLHQDIAAPVAFMTAELADLVIALGSGDEFRIGLIRLQADRSRARFSLAAPAFTHVRPRDTETVELYERVLLGLARQLRTPLEHDVEKGEYHIIIPLSE